MGNVIDLRGVEEWSNDFRWAPGGRYQAQCDKAEDTVSSNGNPMISTRWSIVGGEYEGVNFFDHIVYGSEKAQGKAKLQLKQLGYNADGEAFDSEAVAADLLGKIVTVDLGTEVAFEKDSKIPKTTVIDGKEVRMMNNKVKAYYTNLPQTQAVQQAAPVQQALAATVPFPGAVHAPAGTVAGAMAPPTGPAPWTLPPPSAQQVGGVAAGVGGVAAPVTGKRGMKK